MLVPLLFTVICLNLGSAIDGGEIIANDAKPTIISDNSTQNPANLTLSNGTVTTTTVQAIVATTKSSGNNH